MISLLKSIFSAIAPPEPKGRIYLDASSFDPHVAARPGGRSILLVTHDSEGSIYQRVRQELKGASAVVVLDEGSQDATPYRAAEAGAVVVLQESGQSLDQAMMRAIYEAYRFSDNVKIEI